MGACGSFHGGERAKVPSSRIGFWQRGHSGAQHGAGAASGGVAGFQSSRAWMRAHRFLAAGAQPAEVAHALKARRQHVLEEAAQELLSAQAQRAGLAGGAVLVGEGDGARVAGDQAAGAQRGLLHVGGQVTQGGGAAADRLHIDDPRDCARRARGSRAAVPGVLASSHWRKRFLKRAASTVCGRRNSGLDTRFQRRPSGVSPPPGTR